MACAINQPAQDFFDCGETCVSLFQFVYAVRFLSIGVVHVVGAEDFVYVVEEATSTRVLHGSGALAECHKVVDVDVDVVEAI